MDTVFKIIKNGKASAYGANNFGYDENIILATYYLILENFKPLEDKIYPIADKSIQDFEVIIDFDRKIIITEGFNIKNLECELNYPKLTLAKEDLSLTLKNNFTFSEFLNVYKILKKALSNSITIINNKYLWAIKKLSK